VLVFSFNDDAMVSDAIAPECIEDAFERFAQFE